MRAPRAVLIASHLAVLSLAMSGCDTTRTAGTSGLLGADDGRERWTIRCLKLETGGHAEQAARLVELLKKVQGLDANRVRLVTTADASTIFYGEYVKRGSGASDKLIFPPEYQRDFDLIRRLTLSGATPFAYAEPQVLQKKAVVRGEHDIANAKGSYTLQIAVFYNTPDFTQREQAAVDYVRLLREAGYSAYYRHEDLRSFVFVGEFDASDVVQSSGAAATFGPRVEQFIRQNEAEFRHVSENGQIVRRVGPDGTSSSPLSFLVPVPKN